MTVAGISGSSIPEGRIIAIGGVDLVIDPGGHPWYCANRDAVERHWEGERVRRPFLYNGSMIMHRGLALRDGRIEGISHTVPYATLMYFLSRPDRDIDLWHLYGVPVIVSRDGAVLLTKMSERTANPGRVYSPSGSLDPDDIRDGACDLDGNMRREVAEEAGIDLGEARAEPDMFAYHSGHVVAVFRRFRFDQDARTIAARIDAHIASEAEPEVVEAVIARSADDITPAMPEYMAAMLRHQFSVSASG